MRMPSFRSMQQAWEHNVTIPDIKSATDGQLREGYKKLKRELECRGILEKNSGSLSGELELLQTAYVEGRFAAGDQVVPIDPDKHPLRSGCCAYDSAVIVSVVPFVLVSVGSDMRWESTVKPWHFRKVGVVTAEVLERCTVRL
jgi:hypothetical protein